MKFVTYTDTEEQGGEAPGLLDGELVYDLRPQGFADMEALIEAGLDAARKAGQAARAQGGGVRLAATRLLAPITRPPRIFCVGLNYRAHALESKMPVTTVPTVFMKLASGIIGSGDAVLLPANSTQVDYEAELGLVMGKKAWQLTEENWKDSVFGYTIVNDVSARDVQLATSQWTLGKSFPTFCPLGPYIATPDEVDDAHALQLQMSIDGEVLQTANTRDLIFNIGQILSYITSITPMLPGDLVSTGTPPGVGMGREPQRWLKAGETMTVAIEGLGELRNPVRNA